MSELIGSFDGARVVFGVKVAANDGSLDDCRHCPCSSDEIEKTNCSDNEFCNMR